MNIRKNLLDLKHQRYLQYYSITIIITLTYFISIGIVFVTKQLDYKNLALLTIILAISLVVLGICRVLIIRFRNKMNLIYKEIEKICS